MNTENTTSNKQLTGETEQRFDNLPKDCKRIHEDINQVRKEVNIRHDRQVQN